MIEIWVLAALVLILMGVMYYDAAYYRIPNALSAAIVLVYVVWQVGAPQQVDVMSGLVMAGVLLVFGFTFFALGMLGAGDVKLMAALGLFVGWSETGAQFVIYTTFLGGLMAMLVAMLRKLLKSHARKPRLLMPKEKIPYGLAIAGAFLLLLCIRSVAGLPAIRSYI